MTMYNTRGNGRDKELEVIEYQTERLHRGRGHGNRDNRTQQRTRPKRYEDKTHKMTRGSH
jgi:hypothetical protein